jgi:hypothetical protein
MTGSCGLRRLEYNQDALSRIQSAMVWHLRVSEYVFGECNA